MATVLRTLNFSRTLQNICNQFTSLGVNKSSIPFKHFQLTQKCAPIKNIANNHQHRNIHTTSNCNDLMEFFDDKKNWGENEVKVGRAWKTDELRIKSNSDLHKLWYVLLKERNMLLTMEHECNDKFEYFPSPERIDKVKESMENLETVIRERNKAYFLLETGEDGERPSEMKKNQFGLNFKYKAVEHIIPPNIHIKWWKKQGFNGAGFAVRKFLKLYREKLYNEKRKARNRDRNHVMRLMRRNPNLDKDLLRKKYPSVKIDSLLHKDLCRGHFVPKL